MTKSAISKTWVAGVIVLAAGLLVGGVSLGLMLAYGGHFTPAANGNGYDFTPTTDGFFWTMVGLMIAGFIAAATGGIVQLVAWIGALVNTYPIQDKTWFVILLAGGLIGLAFALVGFAVMVAYIVAGPDGTAIVREQLPAMPAQEPWRPPTLAPTS